MVLLHVKKGEESLFLHSCTLDDPVSEVSISHFLLLLVHTTNSLHTKDTGSLRMHHSSNPHALYEVRISPLSTQVLPKLVNIHNGRRKVLRLAEEVLLAYL